MPSVEGGGWGRVIKNIIKIIIKASSMKHRASWQTAQRLSSRNRKRIWCHPEAKLRKVFVGNIFWRTEFGALCKSGWGRSLSATCYLHSGENVAWEKCNTVSNRQYNPRTPPQSPETCDHGTSVTDFLEEECVCVHSMVWNYLADYFFLNTDKPLQADVPVAPSQTCSAKKCPG